MTDYELLRPYATETQLKYIDAIKKHGSQSKAARGLNVNPRSLSISLKRLRDEAARRGYSPEYGINNPLPENQYLKGTSRLVDQEGNTVLTWYKSSEDKERQEELLKEAVKALCETIKPLKPVKAPRQSNSDLLNCYIITDYHLGMLAWGEESGDDWDAKIAESLLYNWFKEAIKSSPDSETGILCNLGDFLHYDGLEPVTPAHHNVLDADTRFQKLVRITIRVFRRIIDDLLKKHKNVHVIMAEGNHDPASSIWLREMFSALYEKEKRVTVDLNPDPYYCFEHGDTSLFFHHGHKRKPANIDDVFVAKFRDVFGKTKHSYAHLGHFHNKQVKESNLMVVEQHRTLAAKDAYASRGGWISGRDASVITYHKSFGEVGRVTINPNMIQ